MPLIIDILLRAAAIAAGIGLVVGTFSAAMRTFVLPRAENVWLTRWTFRLLRVFFNIFLDRATTYEDRDRIMAFYAPLGLLLLPVIWLTLTTWAYMLIFWGMGVRPLYDAFWLSGSSLLTLGFRQADTLPQMILVFSEATLGLILIAMLISYLPTMYSTFARRETMVNMLEVRAGAPPTAVEFFARAARLNRLHELHDMWHDWELWFAEIEETHTSLAALIFFRSPRPDRSWITAAGAVLDAAALHASTIDAPRDVQADICIRAGYLALRAMADFLRVPYDPHPRPDDPISITRQEFDEVCAMLAAENVPLKADLDQAWKDFAGWRVNYDTALLALAAITMAPYAPWTSDRSPVRYPRTGRQRQNKPMKEQV